MSIIRDYFKQENFKYCSWAANPPPAASSSLIRKSNVKEPEEDDVSSLMKSLLSCASCGDLIGDVDLYRAAH